MIKSKFYSFVAAKNFSILGARSALSMGVAPEAIVKFLYSSIGSNFLAHICDFCSYINNFTTNFLYRVRDQRSRWE
jgi:hypothetical protein